ncbi:hypothetical protein LOAG_09373 [Loa loa]|uniref:Uncharacterized protein n=1 Tax=Loa loa TaxID=7209 RepID=A0A1S0TS10_LOALO|nr:hypothetical protein LOAG_09373 [Loa loa]EFO19121.2 hypothetical protein LOAG_09373 [Loa loa]
MKKSPFNDAWIKKMQDEKQEQQQQQRQQQQRQQQQRQQQQQQQQQKWFYIQIYDIRIVLIGKMNEVFVSFPV